MSRHGSSRATLVQPLDAQPDEPMPRREWLVTNGLGGYASGTVAGAVTRRYHGLLIASLPAPLGRMVMLNHLLERVRVRGRRAAVARRRGRGRRTERRRPHRPPRRVPAGARAAGLALRDRRRRDREAGVMPHGQNTVHVTYRLLSGAGPGAAELRPSVHFRRYEEPVDAERDLVLHVIGDRATATRSRRRTDCPPLRLRDARRRGGVDARRAAASSDVLYQMEAQPRLRVGRVAVESGLLPRRPRARSSRSRWSRRPKPWETVHALSPEDAARGRAGPAPPAAARSPAAPRSRALGGGAGAGGRPVHHHAGRPRRGSGAGPRRRRRGAHRDRRLSLVHRLGPRHDDQPRRADADHRPAPRGRLHPAHVRATTCATA